MSSDKPERRRHVDEVNSVEEPSTVGTLDEVPTLSNKPLRRRVPGSTFGDQGPFAEIERYRRPGYHMALIYDYKAQEMWNNDYEYVKDDKGNPVTVRSNLGKTASNHTYNLMEIRDDFYQEDLINTAKRANELLNQLTPEQAALRKQDLFFKDMGITKEPY